VPRNMDGTPRKFKVVSTTAGPRLTIFLQLFYPAMTHATATSGKFSI
jgi:hypothetical protein